MVAGLKEYPYWSDRLIAKVVADHGIALENNWDFKMTSPTVGGTLPQIEASRRASSASRRQMASRIKRKLRHDLVDIHDLGEPRRYVMGGGAVFYGEFPGENPEQLSTCLLFSATRTARGERVAICLFGSMHNLSTYLKEGGPISRKGWTSSYFNEIQAFVRQRCERPIGHLGIDELAVETLKVAYAAGTEGSDDDSATFRPWNRSYTYGDIPTNVEWFALVHRDVVLDPTFGVDRFQFDRVLIGSPLWLCSSLSDIRRYADHSAGDLEREFTTRAKRWAWLPFSRRRKTNLADWAID